MTSSNGNIFRVSGLLWGEYTGHRWIPLTKPSDTELWCFLWSAPEQTVEQTIEMPVRDAIALIMTPLLLGVIFFFVLYQFVTLDSIKSVNYVPWPAKSPFIHTDKYCVWVHVSMTNSINVFRHDTCTLYASMPRALHYVIAAYHTKSKYPGTNIASLWKNTQTQHHMRCIISEKCLISFEG